MSASLDARVARLTADEWQDQVEFGEAVRFAEYKSWWTIVAHQGRFTVCTRSRPFHTGEREYTIIDWKFGIRGAVNEIGHGWGDGTYSEVECWLLVAALLDPASFHEVSHRNNVTLRITEVRGG